MSKLVLPSNEEEYKRDCQMMYERGRADERAKIINEIFDKAYDVDMDSSLIYIRFDKDDFDIPFMTQKEQLKEWLKEQLKSNK